MKRRKLLKNALIGGGVHFFSHPYLYAIQSIVHSLINEAHAQAAGQNPFILFYFAGGQPYMYHQASLSPSKGNPNEIVKDLGHFNCISANGNLEYKFHKIGRFQFNQSWNCNMPTADGGWIAMSEIAKKRALIGPAQHLPTPGGAGHEQAQQALLGINHLHNGSNYIGKFAEIWSKDTPFGMAAIDPADTNGGNCNRTFRSNNASCIFKPYGKAPDYISGFGNSNNFFFKNSDIKNMVQMGIQQLQQFNLSQRAKYHQGAPLVDLDKAMKVLNLSISAINQEFPNLIAKYDSLIKNSFHTRDIPFINNNPIVVQEDPSFRRNRDDSGRHNANSHYLPYADPGQDLRDAITNELDTGYMAKQFATTQILTQYGFTNCVVNWLRTVHYKAKYKLKQEGFPSERVEGAQYNPDGHYMGSMCAFLGGALYQRATKACIWELMRVLKEAGKSNAVIAESGDYMMSMLVEKGKDTGKYAAYGYDHEYAASAVEIYSDNIKEAIVVGDISKLHYHPQQRSRKPGTQLTVAPMDSLNGDVMKVENLHATLETVLKIPVTSGAKSMLKWEGGKIVPTSQDVPKVKDNS